MIARDLAGNEASVGVSLVVLPAGALQFDAPLAYLGQPVWTGEKGLVDFDGDGRLDLLTYDLVVEHEDYPVYKDEFGPARLLVHLGASDGRFGPAQDLRVSPPHNTAELAFAELGDLTGDRISDLLFHGPSQEIWMAQGLGGGGFATAFSLGFTADRVFLEDLDGDGDLDVIGHGLEGIGVVENLGGSLGTWTLVRYLGAWGPRRANRAFRDALGRTWIYASGRRVLVLGRPAPGGWASVPATAAAPIGSGWIELESHDYPSSTVNLVVEGDVDGDGHKDLIVSLASEHVVLRFQGAGFAEVARFPRRAVIACGDFTGDGHADFAFTDGSSLELWATQGMVPKDRTQVVRMPGGRGAPGGLYSHGVALDLDGDGHAEILGPRRDPDNSFVRPTWTYLLRSRSNGSLRAPEEVSLGPLREFVVGDIDADGVAEVIADVHSGGASSPIYNVVLEQGSTGLTETARFKTYDWRPTDRALIALRDVDGDGRADLISTEYIFGAAENILVRLSAPGGGLAGPLITPHARGSSVVALSGHMDGDRWPDVHIGGRIFAGQGDGRFSAASFTLGYEPYGVADFDGDRRMDLLCVSSSGTHGWLKGDGLGGFATFQPLPAPPFSQPYCFATGDFNGDGHVDVVTAWRVQRSNAWDETQLVSWLNDGRGGFPTEKRVLLFERTDWAPHLAVEDLNGDGRSDVVASARWRGLLAVARGQADGSLIVDPDRWDVAGGRSEDASGLNQGQARNAPYLADLDGDLYGEVVLMGWDGILRVVRIRQD